MVEEAKRRLEAERRDVLRELRKLASDEQRARQRSEERRRKTRELIDRGRAVDVPVTEIADALGVTRQAVYALLGRREPIPLDAGEGGDWIKGRAQARRREEK